MGHAHPKKGPLSALNARFTAAFEAKGCAFESRVARNPLGP